MCGSSDVSTPDPTPAPPSVTETDVGVTQTRDNERKRRAKASGRSSTLLTGGMGSSGASNGKTLLGQ